MSIGIMVFAWLFARALVAFAPLTSVLAQYRASKFPKLLDATVEELTVRLERGDFMSMDLVQVCFASSRGQHGEE
jgi:amidase